MRIGTVTLRRFTVFCKVGSMIPMLTSTSPMRRNFKNVLFYPTAYKPGTLREKLFGAGNYLPANHPAHRYRDIQAVKREGAALMASAPRAAVA
ncbi:putative hypothetical protein [Agrobacterium rubi TR3 = NBRC 13261]|uniref:Uncharacterized protein n=1 Tax=Agrobacterium rubi TR3 = NBRC 13261 TaxID=1368415 RepID=A0A081D2P4_9HYPH|nr:putative hypothetical protein [Agrobacterium rubi TR3 = NBRC 13261]